jgi:6-phosphogluconolactonase
MLGPRNNASHGEPMARSKARVTSLAILLGLGSMAATAAMADTIAYIGNAGSNDIHVFHVDGTTGAMTLIDKAPFVGVDKPGSSTPLAVTPDRRFLIAGVRSQPYVAVTYAIDAGSGKLTHVGNGPLADSMAYIATDRTGTFLLSASYGGNKIAVNPIGPDGIVKPPSAVIPTGPNAHAIQADRSNTRVLATNLGADVILQYRFDAKSGQLAPNDPPSLKLDERFGPRHFVFHPDGKRVYLIGELSGGIVVLDYDADTGTLKHRQTASTLPEGFSGKPWAADLHVTPDGRFLYASERTSSTIRGFKIDPEDGTLAAIESVPTEQQPRGFNIDAGGRFLAAVGEKSDAMTVYAIDRASGRLSKIGAYPVGKDPNWVEFVDLP